MGLEMIKVRYQAQEIRKYLFNPGHPGVKISPVEGSKEERGLSLQSR
jgi:hypothetical protein